LIGVFVGCKVLVSCLLLELHAGVLLALLVSARIYDFSRTVQDVVKVVRIGEGTIKKRFCPLVSISIVTDILCICYKMLTSF